MHDISVRLRWQFSPRSQNFREIIKISLASEPFIEYTISMIVIDYDCYSATIDRQPTSMKWLRAAMKRDNLYLCEILKRRELRNRSRSVRHAFCQINTAWRRFNNPKG